MSALTSDAQSLLEKLAGGGSMPAFVTNSLRKIAADNGIDITPTMNAQDVVDALRALAGSAMTPLDAALLYAGLGWPVFPIHWPYPHGLDNTLLCSCPKRNNRKAPQCRDAAKHPRVPNGVLDATLDEQQIRTWWGERMWPIANVGVDLVGARLLDIAPDNITWHAEFIRRGLPDTLTFASGGGDGHQHYLYRTEPGDPLERICVSGEYDILSAGYAIFPPSRHISGASYAWLPGHAPEGWIW